MKCKFCGTEIQETDKYCPFCGTATKTNESEKKSYYNAADSNNNAAGNVESNASSNPETESSFNRATSGNLGVESKKKMHPALKILIVFLCSLVISGIGLGVSLYFADDILVGLYDVYKEFREEVVAELQEEFGEDFWDDYDDDFDTDEEDWFNGFYAKYDYADEFLPGAIDLKNNSYSTTFADLSFTLPKEWKVYSKSEIAKLYDKYDISSREVKNHLIVYDFYAMNKSSNALFYIDFFNCDYYSEYDNIQAFNAYLKDGIRDYSKNGESAQLAEDSKITLNGIKYEQIAARITDRDGSEYYEYNFTREVNGYYMQITILSYDLNEIGEIINLLNHSNTGENKNAQ